jgi:hypothetical protein
MLLDPAGVPFPFSFGLDFPFPFYLSTGHPQPPSEELVHVDAEEENKKLPS